MLFLPLHHVNFLPVRWCLGCSTQGARQNVQQIPTSIQVRQKYYFFLITEDFFFSGRTTKKIKSMKGKTDEKHQKYEPRLKVFTELPMGFFRVPLSSDVGGTYLVKGNIYH